MRKNIKLHNKKPLPKPHKDTYFFFVKDQGTGAARVWIILLKLAELALTTIYGLALGIFAPICIFFGLQDAAVSYNTAAAFWLVSSIAYIIGMFFVIFNKTKTAFVIQLMASVGTLITYKTYLKLLEGYDATPPTGLFMPSLFITAITLAIVLIVNIPLWIEKRYAKLHEKAPSILGDRERK